MFCIVRTTMLILTLSKLKYLNFKWFLLLLLLSLPYLLK